MSAKDSVQPAGPPCTYSVFSNPMQLAIQLYQRVPRRERGERDRGRRGQRGELRAEGRVGLRDAALLGEERVGEAEAALRLPRHTGR